MHSQLPIPEQSENIKSKASMVTSAGGIIDFLVKNVLKAAPSHLPDKAKDFVEQHTEPATSMLGAPYRAFERVADKYITPYVAAAGLSPGLKAAFEDVRPGSPTINSSDFVYAKIGPYDSYISWKDKAYAGGLLATMLLAKKFAVRPLVDKLHQSSIVPRVMRSKLLGFGAEVASAPKTNNLFINIPDKSLDYGLPFLSTSLMLANTKYLADDLAARRSGLHLPGDLKAALEAQGVDTSDAAAVNKYLRNVPINPATGEPVIQTNIKEVRYAKSPNVAQIIKGLKEAKEDLQLQAKERAELEAARQDAQAAIDSANEANTAALRLRPAVAGVIGAATGGTLGYMLPRKRRDKIFWSLLGSNIGFAVPYVALTLAKFVPAVDPMLANLKKAPVKHD